MLMLPSRILPQRSWAGSIPTVLSHDALNRLLSPGFPPVGGGAVPAIRCCPLERFMCCMFLRRYLQRAIQSEDSVSVVHRNSIVSAVGRKKCIPINSCTHTNHHRSAVVGRKPQHAASKSRKTIIYIIH